MDVDLLNDRSLETREAARSDLVSTYNTFTKNEDEKQEAWQSFFQANVPSIHVHCVVKFTSN